MLLAQELKTLLQLAKEAKKNAYAPYSHFPVGACLKTVEGGVYVGCNIENVSYASILCAEAIAIGQMVVHGQYKISDLVLVTDASEYCPPCGNCLQRLVEFSTPATNIYLFNKADGYKSVSMLDLIPMPFDRSYLGDL